MGEYDRTGTGISDFDGTGKGGHIWMKSGLSVAPATGSGSSHEGDHPAAGITRQWQRSIVNSGGVWTDIEHETGLNYVVTTNDRGCYLRVVEYARNFVGSASAAATPTQAFYVPDRGTGLAPLSGGGFRNIETSKAGRGVTDFDATGPGGDTRARTGTAVSSFTGRGADAFTDSDTGKGVINNMTGKGADAFTDSDTGKGIAAFTGGGPHA